jgi:hypothetical protein
MATRPIEFSADGRELYWLDSRGRDTAAVVAQDRETGTMRVLAEDRRADFTALLLDPLTDRPIAASSSRDNRVAIWRSPACRRIGGTGSRPINTTTRRQTGSITSAQPAG